MYDIQEYKDRLFEIQNTTTPSYSTYTSYEPNFIIDAHTRVINIPTDLTFLAVKNDHEAKTYYFEINRYYDGKDLSAHSCIIQFICGSGNNYVEGIYPVTEFSYDDTNNKLIFGWTLTNEATSVSGEIKFFVRFYSILNNSFTYSFNTLEASSKILPSLDVHDSDLTIQPSVLIAWEDRMHVLNTNITNMIKNFQDERAVSFTQFQNDMALEVTKAQTASTAAEKAKTQTEEVFKTSTSNIGIMMDQATDSARQIKKEMTDYVVAEKSSFKGYSQRESDIKYSNALINEASGTGSVTIDDSVKAPFIDLEIAGKSEQVVTTGAQLFDAKKMISYQQAVIDAVLDNGHTIKVTGSMLYAAATYVIPIDLVVGKTVTMSGKIVSKTVSSAITTIQAIITLTDNKKIYHSIMSGEKAISIPNEIKQFSIGLYVNNSKTDLETPNTAVFSGVMLNVGDTALPWEPYSGGLPSPSLEYPQETRSTGTATTGTQLLDMSHAKGGESNGITVVVNSDGSYSYSGTVTEDDINVWLLGYYDLNAKAIFTLTSGIYYIRGVKLFNYKQALNETDGIISIAEDTIVTGVRVLQLIKGTTYPLTTIYPMLNVGDTPLPWEPYTGGKPSPSVAYPQPLTIGISGKNLFNKASIYPYSATPMEIKQTENGIRIVNTEARTYTSAAVKVKLKPNTTYTLSGDITQTKSKSTIGVRRSTDGGITYSSILIANLKATTSPMIGEKTSFTTDDNEYYAISLFCTYDVAETGETIFENVQLEEGGIKTGWKPYRGQQTVTISLTESLRGIGDIRDFITSNKLIRKIGYYEITDSTNIFKSNEETETVNNFGIDGLTVAHQISGKSNLMCKYLKPHNVNMMNEQNSIFIVSKTDRVYFCVPKTLANTPEEFKVWAINIGLSFIYVLPEPSETELSIDIQTAISNSTLYHGDTTITTICDGTSPDIKVKYVKDIDSAISDLQTQVKFLTDFSLTGSNGQSSTEWANVQRIVQDGYAANMFCIGDQFVEQWTDTVRNKTYEYPWHVNHLKKVELANGESVNAMLIQAQYAHQFGVQFSHQRAFLACPEGLAAGTYYFTFEQTWGANITAGDSVCFTISKDVPLGGKVSGCYEAPDKEKSTWKIYTHSADGKTILETVIPTFEANGTNLGIIKHNIRNGNMNSAQEMAYGWNRWKTSVLRQYLNSSAGIGEWWTAQDRWDVAPDRLIDKAGFLSGVPDNMLNVMLTFKTITYTNTVNDGGGADITYDKVILPSLEQMYFIPQIAGEGVYHEYWKRAVGRTEPMLQGNSNRYPEVIHYAVEDHKSAQYIRLRSAGRGFANYTWGMNPAGYSSSAFGASVENCFAPIVAIG